MKLIRRNFSSVREFWQKLRESNVYTRVNLTKFFLARLNFSYPHCVYETRCEIKRNSLYYSTCVYPLWIWIISDKIWFKEFLSKIVQWIFRNLHPRHCGDTFQCFEDSGVIEFDINFFWRCFHKKWIGTVVAKKT